MIAVRLLAAFVVTVALTGGAPAPVTVEPLVSVPLLMNGITTSRDGRLFGPLQRSGSAVTPELAEVRADGQLIPFPDAPWNNWRPGSDPNRAFVNVVSVRVGPDGALWVIDKGSVGMGGTVLPHGPKLVRIDLATNRVTRIYPLDAVSSGTSFVDDFRFNGRRAYLTDAGKPALIVLDLDTGKARRVLEGDRSTTGQGALRADGRELRDPAGKPVTVNADQLEVSPDGRLLYFQPTTGPMWVVETRHLDDPALSATALAALVKPFARTGSTGGTAIAASGDIYLSDTDRNAIVRLSPDGRLTTVLSDPRLIWVDAMWIDDAGNLLMPASQFSRTAALNGGTDATKAPFTVYKAALGLKAVRR